MALSSSSKGIHLFELDGLRGLLALWVVGAHIVSVCGFGTAHLLPHMNVIWTSFSSAAIAVQVFIMLSGFAIAALIHSRNESYGRFLKARFFRIYPTYLFCLLLGLATLHCGAFVFANAKWQAVDYLAMFRQISGSEQSHPYSHLAAHLTLLHGLVPRSAFAFGSVTLLPPSWSISLEWQFYLLAPLMLWALQYPLGLLALGSAAGLCAHFQAWFADQSLTCLIPWIPIFLVGIVSFKICHRVTASATSSDIVSDPGMWFCVACIVIGIVTGWFSAALAIWGITFGCALNPTGGKQPAILRFVRNSLMHPIIQRIGKMSYPLYLIHWPVLMVLLYAILHLMPSLGQTHALLLLVVIGIPMVFVVANLVHVFVELPLMSGSRRSAMLASIQEGIFVPVTQFVRGLASPVGNWNIPAGSERAEITA